MINKKIPLYLIIVVLLTMVAKCVDPNCNTTNTNGTCIICNANYFPNTNGLCILIPNPLC
jgi:hypothetical protein